MEQIRQAGGDKQQGRTQPPARSSDVSRVGWWFYNTLLWTIKTSSQLSSYNIFPQRPLSTVHGARIRGWGDLRPACPPTLTPRIFPANDRNFKAHKLKYWLAVSWAWLLASDLGVRACRACVCLTDLVVGKLTETSLSSSEDHVLRPRGRRHAFAQSLTPRPLS